MRSARWAAAAVMLSVVVVGCSGDGEAEPREPDSSSAGASVSPAPTPVGPVEPTLPPEARGTDAAAAEAFVKHFWAMVNYAQETGDVKALRELALPGCVECEGGVEGIEEVAAANGRIEGGVATVERAAAGPYRAGPIRGHLVRAVVVFSAQEVTMPGKRPERFARGRATFEFMITITGDGLRIAGWDRQ